MTRTLSLALLLTSAIAMGQAPSPPPPPPLEPEVTVEPIEAEPADEPRLRGGITAGLGGFAPGPSLMFGLTGRIGVQLTRSFGLDLETGFSAGVGLTAVRNGDSTTATVSGVAYYQAAVLGEVLFFDHLYVDLGPMLAGGGWVGTLITSTSSSGSATAYGVAGWLPGAAGKVGFMTGSRDPLTGKRRGFSISVDANLLFGDRIAASASSDGTARANFGIGGGFSAMLMLGYAWK